MALWRVKRSAIACRLVSTMLWLWIICRTKMVAPPEGRCMFGPYVLKLTNFFRGLFDIKCVSWFQLLHFGGFGQVSSCLSSPQLQQKGLFLHPAELYPNLWQIKNLRQLIKMMPGPLPPQTRVTTYGQQVAPFAFYEQQGGAGHIFYPGSP